MKWHSKDSTGNEFSTLYDVFDWDVFIWKIPNLSSIPRAVDYVVQSPLFYFKNASWILKMYPCGQTQYKTEGYIDLLIERLHSETPKHTFSSKIYCKNELNEEFNHKKFEFGFDSDWTYSRVHRFMPSLKESHLNKPLTFVFKFGTRAMHLVSEMDSESASTKSAVDTKATTSRNAEMPEIGGIFKEYLEFKSFNWKICNIPSNPPKDYQAPSPQFPFSSAFWVLKVQPYYEEISSQRNISVVLERVSSEILEQDFMLKISLAYPGEKTTDESLFFDSSCTAEDVFDFSCDSFSFTLTFEMKIRNTEVMGISRPTGVLRNFKELLLNRENADVVIKVKGQEFPAHRLILKTQSPVFSAAFRTDMKEKVSGIIEIDDCDPSTFSDFLCFLYCGELSKLSIENVFSLFATADKYNIPDLKSLCIEFMEPNLSIGTFCDIIAFAELYSEDKLYELCEDFYSKNYLKITMTNKWKSFVAKNPDVSDQLTAFEDI